LVRKQSIIFFGLTVGLLLYGCATIITGKKQSLYIVSNPPGAKIQAERIMVNKIPVESENDSLMAHTQISKKIVLDSTISGITPCFIQVRRPLKDSLKITLIHPDYQPNSQVLKPRFNESAGLNFIIPWNWMIDAMTGSLMRYSLPDTFVLKEIKKTQ
jgi:hypothetical protein